MPLRSQMAGFMQNHFCNFGSSRFDGKRLAHQSISKDEAIIGATALIDIDLINDSLERCKL